MLTREQWAHLALVQWDSFLTILMAIEPGVVYVFDKGYCDYKRWSRIEAQKAMFVTRFKRKPWLKSPPGREGCLREIILDSSGLARE